MTLLNFLQDYRFNNVNKIVYKDKVFIYNKNEDAYLCSYDSTDLFKHVNSNNDIYENVLILDHIVESDDNYYDYIKVESLKEKYNEREKEFYEYVKNYIEDLKNLPIPTFSKSDIITYLERVLKEYEYKIYKNNGSM